MYNIDPVKWYPVKEAAELIGLNKNHLYPAIKQGILRARKLITVRNKKHILGEDLLDFTHTNYYKARINEVNEGITTDLSCIDESYDSGRELETYDGTNISDDLDEVDDSDECCMNDFVGSGFFKDKTGNNVFVNCTMHFHMKEKN